MMTDKTQNYTPEQTLQAVSSYTAGMPVEMIAREMGKSVRSIVAKLSREGVYVAKTKQAVARVKKADLVEILAKRCGVPVEQFESLEKASVSVLETLVDHTA